MERKAVPLDSGDLEAVKTARTDGTLAQLAGESAVKSEATALSALVKLGLAQVSEIAQLRGYEAWAASMDEDDMAYRQAMRGRRRSASD